MLLSAGLIWKSSRDIQEQGLIAEAADLMQEIAVSVNVSHVLLASILCFLDLTNKYSVYLWNG